MTAETGEAQTGEAQAGVVPAHEVELAFTATMAAVATPVCVVTTLNGGTPHGTTVSAFASLSLRPPMVLVALDKGSTLLERLSAGCSFGINLLTAEQAALALSFARKGGDKFAGVAWQPDGDTPRLSGPGGWLLCRVDSFVPGGDHQVVLGTVVDASPAAAAPLTYAARGFGTHLPHARGAAPAA